MLIEVAYFAQAAVGTGVQRERLEADDLTALLAAITHRHGDAVVDLICDKDGALVPWVLMDINGTLVRELDHPISEGDRVRFISPISGG